MGATGGAYELAVKILALLLAPEDTAMMMMMMMMVSTRRTGIMMAIKPTRGAAEIMVMMDVSGELVSE